MTKLNNAPEVEQQIALPKKKRGRPKCFNEEQALQKAMLLFWERGYEATSIHDLTQALEITAPSLYSSFGDKTTLFYKSIDYYLAHEACAIEHIFKQARTAKIAFELFLYDKAKRLVQPDKPKGCMIVTSATNCSEDTQDIQQNLLERRLQTKNTLFQRLQQGINDGDLSNTVPVAIMTDFYCTIIQGMSMQARDGADIDELNRVVEHAMKAWDLFDQAIHSSLK